MTEFNVGDEVYISLISPTKFAGKTGRILRVHSECLSLRYDVEFGNEWSPFFTEELISVDNSKETVYIQDDTLLSD